MSCSRLALLLVALASASACLFDFERDLGLDPGDVAGRATRSDVEAAPYARVHVVGSSREHRTRGDGAFRVPGLVPGGYSLDIIDDKNGDGWPERAGRRTFTIRREAHKQGVFGDGEERTTFVVLGDVRLEGVVEATGAVTREDGSVVVGARVFALRRVALPALAGASDALEVELSADAETATDDEGRFRFPALPAGELAFVAFAEGAEGGSLASVPVARPSTPGTQIRDLVLVVGSAPPTRRARVELTPPPEEGALVRAHVVAPGATPEGIGEAAFARGDEGVHVGGPQLELEVPLGAWDIWVETDDGSFGVLRRQIASRPGLQVITWGRLLLEQGDPCAGTDASGAAIRDCDHDTLQGLPPLDGVDPSLQGPLLDIWRGCAPACAHAFGQAALGAFCEVDGEVYDCDDDGDGQADVTEGFACYGLGRGADPDGDGLCGADDPYPQCRENDPAHESCKAGGALTEFPPRVRPELVVEEVDAGPSPDAGDDAGEPEPDAGDDAGTPDGGGILDAGFDAGPVDAGPPAFVRPIGDVVVADMAPLDTGVALLVHASSPTDLGGCALDGSFSSASVVLLDEWGVCRWSATVTPAAPSADAGMYGYVSLSRLVPLTSGELLVVGTAQGGDVVVEGTGSPITVPGPGGEDLLLFTLDESGAPMRASFAGIVGGGYVTIIDGAPLAGGGFVLVGNAYYSVSLTIGGTERVIADSNDMEDLFLVAFDAAFTPLWSRHGFGVEGRVSGFSVTTTGSGADERVVALVGIDGLVDVDGVGLGLHSEEGGDTVLLGIAAAGAGAGELDWHGFIDSLGGDGRVAPHPDTGVVVAGSSSLPVVLGPSPSADAGPPATSPLGTSGFLARYGDDGAFVDVQELPAPVENSVWLRQLVPLPDGDLVLGGHFSGGFTLGDTPIRDDEVGGEEAFVTRLSGAPLDATFLQRTFGWGGVNVQRLAPLPDGSLLVAGIAYGDMYFGGLALSADPEFGDTFLWRIRPDGSSAEHLLAAYGETCSASGACQSRSCGVPEWASVSEGLCVTSCDLDDPICPEASECRASERYEGVSECVPQGRCFDDSHCGDDRCNPYTLQCEPGCTTRADCAAGEACHPDLGFCVSDCDRGDPCGEGEVCAPSSGGYVCQPDCRMYSSCDTLCGGDGLCSEGSYDINGVLDDIWTWERGAFTWHYQGTDTQLGRRKQHAMAPSGDGVVVLGGVDRFDNSIGALEVWLWQGGAWTARVNGNIPYGEFFSPVGAAGDPSGSFITLGTIFSPGDTMLRLDCCAGSPLTPGGASGLPNPGRDVTAMAYDGERVWLFGGRDLDDGYVYGDLWRFDELPSPTWTPVSPPGSAPEARYDHALSYTGVDGELLLSGGRRRDGALLADTWRLESDGAGGATWTLIAGANLGPRAGHGTAWDGARVVLYGGATSRARPESRDVRIFDEVNDRWVSPRLGGVPPPPRTGVRMAAGDSGLLLYGGERGGPYVTVYDDVQAGTMGTSGGIAWQPRSVSAPGTDAAAFATAPDGSLWVFGGRDRLGALSNELYVYRESGVEGPLTSPLDEPTPREGARMAFHPVSGDLFLFGGVDESGMRDDLWRWDPLLGAFEEIEPSGGVWPFAHAFGAMAASPLDDAILLFGGEHDDGVHGSQWLLSADGTFRTAGDPNGPSGRTEAAAAVGPEGVYLYGGFGYNDQFSISTLSDLWVWRGEAGGWTNLVSHGGYPRLGGATMTFDPASEQLWIVGGNDTYGAYGTAGVYDVELEPPYVSSLYVEDEDLPPRSRHAVGLVGGRLLVVGGSDEPRDLHGLAPTE